MDQSLFIIKTFQTNIVVEMFEIKNGMSTAQPQLFLHFCFGWEVRTTSSNRQFSSTSYTNSIAVYGSKQNSFLKAFKESINL